QLLWELGPWAQCCKRVIKAKSLLPFAFSSSPALSHHSPALRTLLSATETCPTRRRMISYV
ncbi:hypothetical protein BT69DRAFT_1284633, partial [Atractiella rhizophila]